MHLGGLGYHLFLVDAGAKISLIPASLASNIKGKINRQLSRQPVMVDLASAAKARLLVGYVLDHEIFQRNSKLCRVLRREF